MTIDWTTFTLEVINFLVLVWILQRFLYRPVLEVLARRQANVARVLDEARRTEDRAVDLKAQFEHRLADWHAEQATLRAGLQAELEAERNRQMATLSQSLALERDCHRAQEAHREAERQRELEVQAIRQACGFTTRLLSRLAGPELEDRLIQVFIEDLALLATEPIGDLDADAQGGEPRIRIISAFSLTAIQRQRITEALISHLGRPLPLVWVEDRELLAGLRVEIGPWQLDLSLADELAAFAQAANHGG